MNNKYKNIIIIILSIIVILLAIGIGITGFIKSLDKTSNISDNPNSEVKNDDLEKKRQEAIDSFYNNYLITYFLENEIKVNSEDYIMNDNEVYYLVTDEIIINDFFKDIHSEEEFYSLLQKSFNDEEIINKIKKYMKSNYSNKYLNKDGKLYVKKGLETCSVNDGKKVEKNNIYISDYDNTEYIVYGKSENEPTQIFPLTRGDDGKIRVTYLWFNCANNFNS